MNASTASRLRAKAGRGPSFGPSAAARPPRSSPRRSPQCGEKRDAIRLTPRRSARAPSASCPTARRPRCARRARSRRRRSRRRAAWRAAGSRTSRRSPRRSAASSPAPVARALRQAGDQHVGVARHLALGGRARARSRRRRRRRACAARRRSRRSAAAGSRRPCISRPWSTRPMTRASPGDEPHHVAVEGAHHLADALRAGEGRVLGQMQRLAMRRHGDLRLQPGVHAARARRGADGRRRGRDGCGR